jgi:hypothetical protein
MAWFKKEDDVPSLPPAPQLPRFDSNSLETIPSPPQTPKKELPELPSFPSNPSNENLNQEIVKSAVNDHPEDSGDNEVIVEEVPRPLHPQIGIPSVPKKEIVVEPKKFEHHFASPKPQIKPPVIRREVKESEPIFVRIDKFQSAQKDFEQIKVKLKEAESILKKVREVRSKEDSEISEWTHDLENLKSRLQEIDSNIFDQI